MTSMTNSLYLGDFREYAPNIPPQSVDLIFTDPPYKRDLALPCFELLAMWSATLLKPHGSLLTIVPHFMIPDVALIMSTSGLKYRWQYIMDQEQGPHPRMAMGIEIIYKPIFHYVNGTFPSGKGFLRDKAPIPSPEKNLHEWQQAESWAEYYISKLTEPGDLVLDPFVGTGTVPVVAHRLYRRWIGIDKDKEMIDKAWNRLSPTL